MDYILKLNFMEMINMNLNNLDDTMNKLLNAYDNIKLFYPNEDPTDVFNSQLNMSTSFTPEDKEKLLSVWKLILVELSVNTNRKCSGF